MSMEEAGECDACGVAWTGDCNTENAAHCDAVTELKAKLTEAEGHVEDLKDTADSWEQEGKDQRALATAWHARLTEAEAELAQLKSDVITIREECHRLELDNDGLRILAGAAT